ncbi:cysteine--tRNA ligase [Verrucomicrobiaceae bacterium 5K15]|uniref:Cysteine--tRNA ligase n=1 Tax=Oceaniferula flava TaxID=2800421 RepID=A0AAE2VA13_9BACT|nr:cysteine--tRNA ligase [Oceaniferula flavus]MBK1856108.1 cysteine--tRNA ligase [Oceaniferula flavus]MBM1137415.1 cysteine--tRNA ligase [Oceaniferula flavus]
MNLYDTLTRSNRELKPLDGETFRFYCCGPTVYGPAHIGNFRTFVMHDVFRRVLETGGMKTLHVRNITDVDDKTIRDSQAAGKTLKEFTAGWTEKFHADCTALGCQPPHIEPSAIEHIPQQIAMIEQLIEKGHAYASEDGSVYFKVSSFPDYGKLSHLDTRELDLGKTQNQRADADEYEKDSIADFVLWKSRKEEDGENYWSSPWGEGRPGWHLECSAMIKEYLGESFDLHSGGVDLVFPHHENEIAQSQCSCGGDFAAHWFHITHLMVDGGKMSKSLGNLYTIDDLEAKGHTAMEVRYVLISGHYRKQLNFTLDSLHAAKEALAKLAKGREVLSSNSQDSDAKLSSDDFKEFQPAWDALNRDLNTPAALGHLFSGLKAAQKLEGEEAAANLAAFDAILRALGLELPVANDESSDIPAEVKDLADQRLAAKQNKDWAASDQLRDEITALGWTIKDSPDGYELTPS